MYNDKIKVSVILPSYNESQNVKELLERIEISLKENLHEVIVVDDNSPDGTWKIVQDMKNSKFKLIRRMHERGLASALGRGIKEASGNIIVWMDCDLGIPPEDIPRLVDKLDNFDVAVGSRYAKGGKDLRPQTRIIYSIFLDGFANWFLKLNVKDNTSGFIAVRRHVFNKVRLPSKGFGEYFIEFLYHCVKNKFKIVEVGYVFSGRKSGKSKYNSDFFSLLGLGIKYLETVFKLKLGIK